MNRRGWLQLTLATLPTACRRSEAPATKAPVAAEPEIPWQPLADHWESVMGGELSSPTPGTLRLQWGESLSAAKWTGPPLEPPFEIEFEARRIDGTDFFSGLTFPARPTGECLTWIVGGWGGSLVGISSIDDRDASENETTRHMAFEKDRWYHLRLIRVGEKLSAWIDGVQMVDLDTTGKKLSLRPGPIDQCAPLGLATWQSTGEFRNIRRAGTCG